MGLNSTDYFLQTSDSDVSGRHLLLAIKVGETEEARGDRENRGKFLCGHDERHWFVAGVEQAKNALKPNAVREGDKSP